jgi:hypothetical protein
MVPERVMKRVAPVAIIVLALIGVSCAKAKPSFAGQWNIDIEATKASATEAKMDGLALFMEHFSAEQDAKTFSMKVDLGPMVVNAIYNLDGSVSKNMSPSGTSGQPPIEVVSNAKWDGDVLVVTSTSASPTATGPVEVKSTRKLWLDAAGRLVIERTGTPETLVRSSRSVYAKAK